jgi:SlyX protein
VADTKDVAEREALMARITELEVKVAFQDRTIDELDGLVRAFTDQLEELTRQIETVRSTLADLRETGPANEKPPHY